MKAQNRSMARQSSGLMAAFSALHESRFPRWMLALKEALWPSKPMQDTAATLFVSKDEPWVESVKAWAEPVETRFEGVKTQAILFHYLGPPL